MTELRLQNVVCQVWNLTDQANAILYNNLAYKADGYFFSPAYKSGTWDGYTRLYKQPTSQRPFGKFWTGLAYRAATALDQANIPYTIVDERNRPAMLSPAPTPGLTARNHQSDALAAIMKAGRGIVKMATGGGKTPLAAGIMAHINHPAMFIVHRTNLLKQSVESFKHILGIPPSDNDTIGIIQGEKKIIRHFNVAMIQTLNNLLWAPGQDAIKDFIHHGCKTLIVDEAHHGQSDQYKNVLENFFDAYYRIGLSATPHTKEQQSTSSVDMEVEGCFGRVIHTTGRQALQDQKYLAKAHVFFI